MGKGKHKLPLALGCALALAGLGLIALIGSAGRPLPSREFKVMTLADGWRYEGQFLDGQYDGQGVMTGPDGGFRYEGQFLNGQMNGQGVMTWADGWRYEGQFLNGQRTGQGVMTWGTDGWRYEGQFLNGQRTGQGIMTWVGGKRYNGQWLNDMMNGQGVMTYTNGWPSYNGQWLEDSQNGYGVERWNDGSYYEGSWWNGQKDGYGIFYAPNNNFKGQAGLWREGLLLSPMTPPPEDAWLNFGPDAQETDHPPASPPTKPASASTGAREHFDWFFEAFARNRELQWASTSFPLKIVRQILNNEEPDETREETKYITPSWSATWIFPNLRQRRAGFQKYECAIEMDPAQPDKAIVRLSGDGFGVVVEYIFKWDGGWFLESIFYSSC